MRNTTRVLRYPFGSVRRIHDHRTFSQFFLDDALGRYSELVGEDNLGSVLGVCNKAWEADAFVRYPFSQITLSGIVDQREMVERYAAQDARVSYDFQNAESLRYPSGSFDLVYCKEGLHHLARPLLGLYEMLRVCRKCVVLIEPNSTFVGKVLEGLGLASTFEKNQDGNIRSRDNYVFRFSPGLLRSVLNSYYLKSGYVLELRLGWLSSRYFFRRGKALREALCLAGFAAGSIPGSRGNYMTAIIMPGTDVPPDPIPFTSPAQTGDPSSAH